MRISDWSSDVCSSDLSPVGRPAVLGSGDWETGSYFLRLDLIADHWSGSLNDEPREAVAINDRQHWSALVHQRLQRGERICTAEVQLAIARRSQDRKRDVRGKGV